MKKQPIRIQEIRCELDGITSNFPILSGEYVRHIDCIGHCIFFASTWYKKAMQRPFVVYKQCPTCHLYFLGTHTRFKTRMYTKIIQVITIRGITRGIPRAIPLKKPPFIGHRKRPVQFDLKSLFLLVKKNYCHPNRSSLIL